MAKILAGTTVRPAPRAPESALEAAQPAQCAYTLPLAVSAGCPEAKRKACGGLLRDESAGPSNCTALSREKGPVSADVRDRGESRGHPQPQELSANTKVAMATAGAWRRARSNSHVRPAPCVPISSSGPHPMTRLPMTRAPAWMPSPIQPECALFTPIHGCARARAGAAQVEGLERPAQRHAARRRFVAGYLQPDREQVEGLQ